MTTKTTNNKKNEALSGNGIRTQLIVLVFILLAVITLFTNANAQNNQSVNLGKLTNYLFVFTDGSKEAKWQQSKYGYIGNVAINGKVANEKSSIREKIPYAGVVSTSDGTLSDWQSLLTYNPTQASAMLNQVTTLAELKNDLQSAFAQINALTPTVGYTNVNAASLNGLNTKNNIAQTFVMNITKGFKVSDRIYITGDAGDKFILRWDEDANPANGYQGEVKFQRGSAIIPMGDLTPTNFIHVAGDISASGGGNTPPAPYPQGPRKNFGKGALINNGADFDGGGFFTGYWLTKGKDRNNEMGSLNNAVFVGGLYTSTTKFHLSRNCGGVYMGNQCPTLNEIAGDATIYSGSSIMLSNASAGGTWSSSNTAIATVNSNTGSVQGINPGNVIIYYTTTTSCSPAIKNITVLDNRIMKIGNLVWYDQNRNGVQDNDESGVSGVKVNIYSDANSDNMPDGAALASVYTNTDGNYLFENLLPGNYIVGIIVPAGYMSALTTSTSMNPDNDNQKDNNGVEMRMGEMMSKTISLVWNMEPMNDGDNAYGNLTIDFGMMGTASLGDFVWNDINGNGIQDGDSEMNEPGIENVLVTITYPNGATETTTTDAAGKYSFGNLAPGSYSLLFGKPYGYNYSLPLQGYLKNMDSDAIDGVVSSIPILPGENKTSIDAAFRSTCLTLQATSTVVLSSNANSTLSINVEATGGLPPYTGTGTFQVAPGEFWFIVSDSYGCTTTTYIDLTSISAANKSQTQEGVTEVDNAVAEAYYPESVSENKSMEKTRSSIGVIEKTGENTTFINSIVFNAYPNPCVGTSTIEFKYIKGNSHAQVEIFTITGQKISTIFNDNVKQNETYRARFEAGSLPQGTYIYKITCGTDAKQGRLMLK